MGGVLNARRHRNGIHSHAHERRNHFHDVLNARRHRNGIHWASQSLKALPSRAQRPKASERNSPRMSDRDVAVRSCSTPEGIGTEFTTHHAAGDCHALRCSTPEGIGTEFTAQAALAQWGNQPVLNARRHRNGIHTARTSPPPNLTSGAQRPKASERNSPSSTLQRN